VERATGIEPALPVWEGRAQVRETALSREATPAGGAGMATAGRCRMEESCRPGPRRPWCLPSSPEIATSVASPSTVARTNPLSRRRMRCRLTIKLHGRRSSSAEQVVTSPSSSRVPEERHRIVADRGPGGRPACHCASYACIVVISAVWAASINPAKPTINTTDTSRQEPRRAATATCRIDLFTAKRRARPRSKRRVRLQRSPQRADRSPRRARPVT
jgi:hypothetical protein